MFEKRGIPFVLLDLTCLVLGMSLIPFNRLLFTPFAVDISRFVACYNPGEKNHRRHVSGVVNVLLPDYYLTSVTQRPTHFYTNMSKHRVNRPFLHTSVHCGIVFSPDNKIGRPFVSIVCKLETPRKNNFF